MESSRKLFSAVLVLMLLLLAADEMGGLVVAAEAEMCESPSGRFKGPCVFPPVCANVCKKEEFQDGNCRERGSFLARCMCAKQCAR